MGSRYNMVDLLQNTLNSGWLPIGRPQGRVCEVHFVSSKYDLCSFIIAPIERRTFAVISYHTLCHTVLYFVIMDRAIMRPIYVGFYCRWFSTRLQYLHCVSNGDTAVLHWTIDIFLPTLPVVYNIAGIIVARLSKSLATLTLGSSKINQHCWRFHGSGVIAAPQIIGLISFCTGMHHEYFLRSPMCFRVPHLCSKIPKINNWTGEFATVIWCLHCFTVSFRGDVRGESGPR